MRCYICNVELSTSEIQLDEDNKSEPCGTCQNIIMDTAYTDGFEPGEPAPKREHNTLLEDEEEENGVA